MNSRIFPCLSADSLKGKSLLCDVICLWICVNCSPLTANIFTVPVFRLSGDDIPSCCLMTLLRAAVWWHCCLLSDDGLASWSLMTVIACSCLMMIVVSCCLLSVIACCCLMMTLLAAVWWWQSLLSWANEVRIGSCSPHCRCQYVFTSCSVVQNNQINTARVHKDCLLISRPSRGIFGNTVSHIL